jgi:hypothetical protein
MTHALITCECGTVILTCRCLGLHPVRVVPCCGVVFDTWEGLIETLPEPREEPQT